MADAGSLLEEKMDEKTFVTKAQWQEVVMQTCTDPENQSAFWPANDGKWRAGGSQNHQPPGWLDMSMLVLFMNTIK